MFNKTVLLVGSRGSVMDYVQNSYKDLGGDLSSEGYRLGDVKYRYLISPYTASDTLGVRYDDIVYMHDACPSVELVRYLDSAKRYASSPVANPSPAPSTIHINTEMNFEEELFEEELFEDVTEADYRPTVLAVAGTLGLFIGVVLSVIAFTSYRELLSQVVMTGVGQ